MTSGQKLKCIRKAKGLTQKQLGELCGIAEPTVRKYELGSIEPKLCTIMKFAKALNVNPLSLLPDYFIDAVCDHIFMEEKGYA